MKSPRTTLPPHALALMAILAVLLGAAPSNCEISPCVKSDIFAGSDYTVATIPGSCTRIILEDSQIGDVGAGALAEALKTNTEVTELFLARSNIFNAGAIALAAALKENNAVRDIHFYENTVGDDGAVALAEMLKVNTGIVSMSFTSIYYEPWEVLQDGIFGNVGAAAFAEALKVNSVVTDLGLNAWQWTKVNDNTIIASIQDSLAANLNPTCNDSKRNGDEIGIDCGGQNCGACPPRTCYANDVFEGSDSGDYTSCNIPGDCTTLVLRSQWTGSDTPIHSSGLNVGVVPAGPLAEALKVNTAVTTLEIHDVNFGDVGMVALGEALETNTAITTLLQSCFWCSAGSHLGDDGAAAIAKALTGVELFHHQNDPHDRCLANEIVTNADECVAAAVSLGLDWQFETPLNTFPTGCFFYDATGIDPVFNHDQTEHRGLWWNSDPTDPDYPNMDPGSTNSGDVNNRALRVCFSNDPAPTANTALTTLHLKYNNIGDDGAAALAGALKVNNVVTELSITENSVGDVGANALAEMLKVNTALTMLHIDNNNIGNIGAAALDEALKVNSVLTDMNSLYNAGGWVGNDTTILDSIVASLAANKNPTCADSKRNGDEVGTDCGGVSCNACPTCNDSTRNGDEIGIDCGGQNCGACPPRTCYANDVFEGSDSGDYTSCNIPGDCTTLVLRSQWTGSDLPTHSSGLNVGVVPAGPLAEALKVNTAVTTLEIHDVNFGDVGMAALGEALETNTAITTLLQNCFWCSAGSHLGDDGAVAIAKALETSTTALTTLRLEYNNIGDDGAAALAGALKVNNVVTELSIMENSVGDVGANALAEMLKVNTALTMLHIDNNNIGNIGAAALDEALKVNSVLTDMNSLYNAGGWVGNDTTILDSIVASLAANKNPTCADSKRNGDEVGTDCGGVSCNACPTCNDDGVDCGNGECVDGANAYTCACTDGWDGADCKNDIDDCAGVDCSGHGTCVDGIAAHTCVCDDYYYRTNATSDCLSVSDLVEEALSEAHATIAKLHNESSGGNNTICRRTRGERRGFQRV